MADDRLVPLPEGLPPTLGAEKVGEISKALDDLKGSKAIVFIGDTREMKVEARFLMKNDKGWSVSVGGGWDKQHGAYADAAIIKVWK